ncbi:sulfotransferase [Kineosporia sp. NBRC 101731]|uniref:sulfotransferase family protein n=1 Tax=Kineosporia sp. NBRC 101731 TaxID=3032199 RepID=UPI0024A3A613|nr:sulfotransferase [Kineosporia sp. NBRC 101731]GLY30879.1 sulfotransferase [Kineosporia sp. NBRC 101731]
MNTPLLLGGEHRSGTTLLSVVLDSHPALDVGPELDFAEPTNLGTLVIETCRLLREGDPRVLGPGTDTNDPAYYDVAHFVKQCERYGIPPATLSDLVEQQIAQDGRDIVALRDRCRLLDRIGKFKMATTGKLTWGIKLQRKIQDVDRYAQIFPGSRFIHIIRDGRDVAASHLRTVPDWGYRSIDDTAYKWANLIEATRLRAPAQRYHEIRYEDLVGEPEKACRALCDFLEIPFASQMLQHHLVDHTLHAHDWSHPSSEATKNPLSEAPVGRYRHDLTAEQIADFENIASGTLRTLGYAV